MKNKLGIASLIVSCISYLPSYFVVILPFNFIMPFVTYFCLILAFILAISALVSKNQEKIYPILAIVIILPITYIVIMWWL